MGTFCFELTSQYFQKYSVITLYAYPIPVPLKRGKKAVPFVIYSKPKRVHVWNSPNYSSLLPFFLFAYWVQRPRKLPCSPVFFDYRYYQDDERITKKELRGLLETNEKALAHWKKSRTLSTLTWVAIGAQTGFLVWELERARNNESLEGPLIGVLGSGAFGLVMAITSVGQKRKAILTYNSSIESKTSLRVAPSRSGLGIALIF